MITAKEILKSEYSKLVANPDKLYAQNPLIIKAAYSAMEKYAKEQMVTLLQNISNKPIDCYSQKIKGQEKQYFLGRTYIENLITQIKTQ